MLGVPDYLHRDGHGTWNFAIEKIRRETRRGSVAANIDYSLVSDLSYIFLQLQTGPTDLFMVVPRNDAIFPKLHTNRYWLLDPFDRLLGWSVVIYSSDASAKGLMWGVSGPFSPAVAVFVMVVVSWSLGHVGHMNIVGSGATCRSVSFWLLVLLNSAGLIIFSSVFLASYEINPGFETSV